MVTHMKTTVEIADGLLARAKRAAKRRGMPLRRLIEEGLRRVLSDETDQKPFQLRDVSFGGSGFTPEFANASWEKIRETIYEGHGG